MKKGTTILHYKILEKLGEGGMGVVYKAQDTKLDRTVALKFLPPHLTQSREDKQRFTREAKSAAALNHPNICTIYSVDEYEDRQFISMEYIDGLTLSSQLETGSLKTETVLQYAIQIADALAEAHEKGIIHRDIKPGNIMIDSKNRIKVMDFGLAKTAGSSPITQTGTTVGTVAYMSPEQIQNQPLDPRADLFSFGVMLYEMLSGERPFKGQYDAALTYAIANEDPPLLSDLKPDLPEKLSRLVNRLLEKDPEDRYSSAKETAEDLNKYLNKSSIGAQRESAQADKSESFSPERSNSKSSANSDSTSITINLPPLRSRTVMAGLSAGLIVLLLLGYWLFPFSDSTSSASDNTIAVLPLESVSRDSADARFADGVHEELINRLAGIRDLTVIARSSVLGYSPGERDLQAIASELDVSSLMEGTVRRAGDQLRVSVQLINANNLGTQWSGSFEENVDDVFEIQSRIARQVADELQASISTEERRRLENRPTDNPQAYRMYMQAREYLSQSKFNPENLLTSQELLNKAVDEDPGFAQAWAMLTVTYSYLYWIHARTPERLDMVIKTAERAQELAPNQPETEIAVGMSLYWSETDNERTLSYFQTILQRFPNQTILHLYIALTHRRLGNWESVIEHLNNALELDPLNSNHYLELAWNFWLMRQYDKAQATLDKLRELKPNANIPFSFYIQISVSRDGTLKIFEEYLDRLRPADIAVEEPLTWGYYNLLKRNWKEANRGYRNSEYETIRSDEARYLLRDYFIGLTYDRMGNQSEANRYYEIAKEHLEKLTDEHPNESRYRTALGRVYARLGEEEKAVYEGEKATELTPFSQNANAGSYFEFQLAEIYAWTGHEEKAIDKLEFALSVPSHAHRNWIELHPRWDPLRDNPRFQELISEEDEPYLEDL